MTLKIRDKSVTQGYLKVKPENSLACNLFVCKGL